MMIYYHYINYYVITFSMKLNPFLKNFIAVILILIAIGGIFSLLYSPLQQTTQIPISQLVSDINQDKVKKISVSGNTIDISYHDNSEATSMKESNAVLPELLLNLGTEKDKLQKVEISAKALEESIWSWLL